MYFLTKTDEERNEDRVYGIVVGSSLYGSHCVMLPILCIIYLKSMLPGCARQQKGRYNVVAAFL